MTRPTVRSSVSPEPVFGFPLLAFPEDGYVNPGFEEQSESLQRIQDAVTAVALTDCQLYLAHGYTPPPTAFTFFDLCQCSKLEWAGEWTDGEPWEESEDRKYTAAELEIPDTQAEADERAAKRRRRDNDADVAQRGPHGTSSQRQTVTQQLRSQKAGTVPLKASGPLTSTQVADADDPFSAATFQSLHLPSSEAPEPIPPFPSTSSPGLPDPALFGAPPSEERTGPFGQRTRKKPSPFPISQKHTSRKSPFQGKKGAKKSSLQPSPFSQASAPAPLRRSTGSASTSDDGDNPAVEALKRAKCIDVRLHSSPVAAPSKSPFAREASGFTDLSQREGRLNSEVLGFQRMLAGDLDEMVNSHHDADTLGILYA